MSDATEQTGEQFGLASDFPTANNSGFIDSGSTDSDVAAEDGGHEAAAAPSQRNEFLSLARELVETIVLALIIFLVVRQGIQNYRIESHSMQPNFQEGQFVLVNKLAYKLGEPQRGDVVVFHNPNNTDEDYIKRIIGLPGDVLEFEGGQVIVNGLPLDEPYVNPPTNGSFGAGPQIVEDDHIFVMGDNRPNSRDSRAFGQLSQDLMVGKAWLRVWPFSVAGTVGHIDIEPGVPAEVESN